jgi:hypothetical protein
MVLSNNLAEKDYAIACGENQSFYLKVKINGAIREYHWSDCKEKEENQTMTELAKYFIDLANSKYAYIL